MDGMFSAQCPEFFTGGDQTQFYESFEDNSGKFRGTITKETDPFCGRYSLKNPDSLYYAGSRDAGLAMSQYSQVFIIL
ncbi:MAG: hypothetical protein AB2693_25305 [Candidatus Thiodiazotropha sp.]